MIKAIETEYNGDRFRSRLEARWAVFFNTLDVKYEYEREGFDLYGDYYLPDFWLPNMKCWVEIKHEDISEKEKVSLDAKMKKFADNIAPIICFLGIPSISWNGIVYCFESTDSVKGGRYQTRVGFDWCNICNKAILSFSDEDTLFMNNRRVLHNFDWTIWKTFCATEHRDSHTVGDKIYNAAESARQARFEHGECGVSPRHEGSL